MVLLPKSNFVNLSKFYKNAIEDPIFKVNLKANIYCNKTI